MSEKINQRKKWMQLYYSFEYVEQKRAMGQRPARKTLFGPIKPGSCSSISYADHAASTAAGSSNDSNEANVLDCFGS